jgi:hypothetical protein
MKRYRIIETGRTPVTDEEIERLKPPFSSLQSVENLPPGSTGKKVSLRPVVWVSLGAAVILSVLIIRPFFKAEDKPLLKKHDEPLQIAQPVNPGGINPPQPEQIRYENFVVKAGKKSVFKTSKGSQISVPAQAFIYPDGSPCNKPVDVQFAEFHNVAEVFLSGVPMQYDSSGVTYTFESAGMFNIVASSEGQPLKLAQNKGITIDLVSDAEGTYNLYYFDPVQNSWDYRLTEDKTPSAHGPSGSMYKQEKTERKQEKPVQSPSVIIQETNPDPVEVQPPAFSKRDKNNFAFKVDIDESRFPELAGIRNLLFEVEGNSAENKYLRGTWDSISLQRGNDDEYTISLFRLKKNFTFKAHPVLDEKSWEEAMTAYRLAEEQRAAQKKTREARSSVNHEVNEIINANIRSWAFSRGTTIYDLGYWNWDKPVPQPVKAKGGMGTFVDSRGNTLNPSLLFIAQRGTNILWNYKPHQKWMYSSSQENLLWFVLPDGRYALVDDQTIKQMGQTMEARIVSLSEALEEIQKFI